MRPKKQSPSIFKYHDFRKFLKELFLYNKTLNRHFTFRYFSQKSGLASPSALKEIVDGKKNLTQSSIIKVASGFKLNKSETEYFTHLVYFNQSETEAEKTRYYQALSKIQNSKKGKTLTSEQFEYYSNWYNSAIRELAATPGFKDDAEWIAGRLNPRITPAEARKAVDLLLRLGLLVRKEDGTLKQDSPKLEVDPDVTTLSIRNFNRSMIDLGREAIERHAQEQREVSGLTLGISKECAVEIKNMIREFKKSVLQYAANDTRTAEEVFQLNFQYFPLSGNGAQS
ncbi:MAG: TIGR02147 family protein [Fibrobacterota bacterium]